MTGTQKTKRMKNRINFRKKASSANKEMQVRLLSVGVHFL